MPNVTCPSCGEKGKIPSSLIGTRIKCRKCSTAFLVGPAGAKAPAPPTATEVAAKVVNVVTPRVSGGDGIQVEGLDDSAWASTAVAPVEHDHEHDADPESHSGAFTATPHETGDHKQYKLVTPKDKYFEGKFDLDKLEEYLNLLARQGWSVRGMATPHVNIFGSEKEQLVLLLER